MATNIRRSLFIGIGGTGINAILNTKKMFLDTYGEVPPMVGFLGIDTDKGEFEKQRVMTRNGKRVMLDADEQVSISVLDPFSLFERNKNYLNWFPNENASAMVTMTEGAGQVRSNGRFAFWVNHENVRISIQNKLSDITRLEHIDNEAYKVVGNNTPVIHMIFSICGGTGCGSFLSVAYLIREHFPGHELNGYAVMPGVFISQVEAKVPNARPNAFGSIVDIDWLMCRNVSTEKIELENLNARFQTNMPPFDTVKLIDNTNATKDCVSKIDDLCAMIGLSLATLSGDTSAGVNSDLNNLKVRMYSRNYDIGNKVAWASGMGMCEITVNGNELGALYALKAAQQIIDTLQTSKGDATKAATQWINDMEIRENEGYDQVTDYMLPKAPRQSMPEILNVKSPKGEASDWLNRVAYEATDVKDYPTKVAELSEKVSASLNELVDQYLQQNGVKSTENLLIAIQEQINACNNEMTEELSSHKEKVASLDGALAAAESTLANYDHAWYSLSKNLTEEYKNNVNSAARNVAINHREIVRREAAINFYSKLLAQLTTLLNTVKDIADRLNALHAKFEKQKAAVLYGVEAKKPLFQIDLTENYVDRIQVTNDSLTSYFLGKNNVLAMAKKTEQELEDIFIEYTKALDEAQQWASITIDQVYKDLSPANQTRILTEAVQKSSPLLNFNIQSQGIVPKMQPDDTFVVGVYDQSHSPISAEAITKLLKDQSSKPEFCSTGSKTSIIIYRMVGPVPPCVLQDIDICRKKAEEASWNIHFDAMVESRMEQEGWSIYPQEGTSDALELWIKGLMFGMIRNEKGRYQYRDYNESSRALDDYWVDLNHPKAGDRATAFNLFKLKLNDKKMHDTFVAELEKRIMAIGQEKYQEKVKAVKDMNYYYDKVSQINLQRDTLNGSAYEDIKKQLISEVDYIAKKL